MFFHDRRVWWFWMLVRADRFRISLLRRQISNDFPDIIRTLRPEIDTVLLNLTVDAVTLVMLALIDEVWSFILWWVVTTAVGVNRNCFVVVLLNFLHYSNVKLHHIFDVKVHIWQFVQYYLKAHRPAQLCFATSVPTSDLVSAPVNQILLVLIVSIDCVFVISNGAG